MVSRPKERSRRFTDLSRKYCGQHAARGTVQLEISAVRKLLASPRGRKSFIVANHASIAKARMLALASIEP
jgi:hypothetical protein